MNAPPTPAVRRRELWAERDEVEVATACADAPAATAP